MTREKDPVLVIPGGGSGCITQEDGFFDLTPNIFSISHPYDNGGHTKILRTIIGVLAPGDATHRLAVHIRNPHVRKLFDYRWTGEHSLNGHRPMNELLAAAEKMEGSHSGGIKMLEAAFEANYLGRVMPVSDNDAHLRAHLSDGTTLIGEDMIDQRRDEEPKITDLDFVNSDEVVINPNINPEVEEALDRADYIIIPSGDWWTSIMPILKTPGMAEAIRYNRNAKIVWFCNLNTKPGETGGYTADTFSEQLVEVLGRAIDFAFINEPNHALPPAYQRVGSQWVNPELGASKLILHTHTIPLYRVENIAEWSVVRHDKKLTTEAIKSVLV